MEFSKLTQRKKEQIRLGPRTDQWKIHCHTQAEQDLDINYRDKTSRIDTLAIILDLLPVIFAKGNQGIAIFAEPIFKAGQTIPYGVPINWKSYLPMKTTTNSCLEWIFHE